MMKQTKKIFFLMFFVAILNAVFAQPSGKCGKNVSWTLQNNGTLIIQGFGETFDYNKTPPKTPFLKSGISEKIKTIDLTQFHGEIRDNLFYGCQNLHSIILLERSSVKFSSSSFNGCTGDVILEVVPQKIDNNNRCRVLLDVSPEIIQKYNIPIPSIQHIIYNIQPTESFKPIQPFDPIETYSSLRRGRGENGELIVGQWQNGGWNGVVQRTETSGEGYFRYVRRRIAIEVDGKVYNGQWPYKKCERHTDVGPSLTDFWELEELLGPKEAQHDYYRIEKDGTNRLFCQIIESDKEGKYNEKYKCIFPNGDYFIADRPTHHENFKGLLYLSNGNFYYGDFDGNAINFEHINSYGLPYPFNLMNGTKWVGYVRESADIMNVSTGKGIFYNKVQNKFVFGLWGKGEFKGPSEEITIEDIFDCPLILPLDLITDTYVKDRINKWEKKDEFETTQEWRNRTSESQRQQKQTELEKFIQTEYLKEISKKIHLNIQLGMYDADNKSFPITEQTFGTMNIFLDDITPQAFKASWDKIIFIPTFFINNNKIDIFTIDFLLFDEKIDDYRKVAHCYNNVVCN